MNGDLRCLNTFVLSLMWVRAHATASIATCAFEKYPMTGQVSDNLFYRELLLRDPVSMLDCAVKCIRDTSCVSFMVNLGSKRCRFHYDRISSLSNLRYEYGFVSYDTCRAVGPLGQMCTSHADCMLRHTKCVGTSCQCEKGYTYSDTTRSCNIKVSGSGSGSKSKRSAERPRGSKFNRGRNKLVFL